MFRRLPSGLPKDPIFATNLEQLGYVIAKNDEIRSIENPKAYFRFFLTKNDRHNCMQREAMNEAIRKIIYERLQDQGLQKIRLPLGAGATDPNLPIFVSSDLSTKSRVVILFYENNQDLGVFALRIVGGKGGINQGSAVNLVKYIQEQHTSPTDPTAPGIILANMGQLRWWRRGKKAITQTSWWSIPQKSSVEKPYLFDQQKNTIPGNRSMAEHVDYIFNVVVEQLAHPKAKLDLIGVSDGAMQLSGFLDNFANFKKWGGRINAFAALASCFREDDMKNAEFAQWLLNRGRTYFISKEPLGTFLASPLGTKHIPPFGCPCFSLGEPYYSELMLPKGYKVIIDWFQEVAADPEYLNPVFHRIDDGENDEEQELTKGWEVPEEERWDMKGVAKVEEVLDQGGIGEVMAAEA